MDGHRTVGPRTSLDGRGAWGAGGAPGGARRALATRRAWAASAVLVAGIALATWALAVVRDRAPRPAGPPAGRDAAPATVVVYRLRDGMPAYESDSYVPSERPARGHGTEALLEEALEELVKGVTPDERAAGLTSVFSPATAGSVESVEVDAGRAIVDFGYLRAAVPAGGTSEGGTIMLAELNHTVFQFRRIDEVEYRMGGSCGAFWRFLQATCDVVTRAELERAP